MEKNPERDGTTCDLLSQSYNDGIRRLLGHDQDIFLDFEIPLHIVEQRETAWNNLFNKYSSMVSEAELNIFTLKPDEKEYTRQTMQQRMLIRKPMSMVQYWVNTGNLPYVENCDNRAHSDSGSSLAEEECLESAQAANLSGPSRNSEMHSKTAEIYDNLFLGLTSLSSSSVDTAAYILANNNTTKKAETIAIVEGSKLVDKQQNHTLQYTEPISSVKKTVENLKVIDVDQKKFTSEKSVQKETSNLKLNHFNNCNVDTTKERLTDSDLDQTKIISEKSVQVQANGFQSIFGSESDESVFKSKYNTVLSENNVIQRKKLYKNTDSPADFTPASDDSINHRALRVSVTKCEHPALQTPKLYSTPSYLKHQRLKYKKKKYLHLLYSISSKAKQKNKNKSFNNDENNTLLNSSNESNIPQNCNKNSRDSQNLKDSKTKYNECLHFKINDNSSDVSTILQYPLNREKKLDTKSSDHLSNYMSNKYQLKHLSITLHRLPYVYGNPKSTINVAKKKNYNDRIQYQKESAKSDIAFSDEDDFMNLLDDLFQNTTNNQKTATTFISVDHTKLRSPLKKAKAVKAINDKAMLISPHQKSTVRNSRKDGDKTIFDKFEKYILVISSSDESESVKHLEKQKLTKRPVKRRFVIDEKSSKSNKHAQDKSLVNLNAEKRCTELKSTEFFTISKTSSLLSKNKNSSSNISSDEKSEKDINSDACSDVKEQPVHVLIEQNLNQKVISKRLNELSLIGNDSQQSDYVKRISDISKQNKKKFFKKDSLLFFKHKRRVHQLHLSSSSDEEDILLPATKTVYFDKNVKLNIQTISTDENPVVSFSRKNVQKFCDTLPDEGDLQLPRTKCNTLHKTEAVNHESLIQPIVKSNKNSSSSFIQERKINQLINKPPLNENSTSSIKKNKQFSNLIGTINKINTKLNDNQNSRNSSLKCLKSTFANKKDNALSLEFSDEENFVHAESNKLIKVTNNKDQNKKKTLSNGFSHNVKRINSNQKCKYTSNNNKLSPIKTKRERSTILILSDEECIIPLKMKCRSVNSQENSRKK